MAHDPEMPDRLISQAALAAGMQLVEDLNGEDDVPSRDVTRVAREVGHEELFRALAALVLVWLHWTDEPLDVVPALIRRVRGQGAREDALPMVAGTLTAAALEQPPDEWRLRWGPIELAELAALTLAAAQLADYVDFDHGQGFTGRVTRDVFAGLRAEGNSSGSSDR